MKSSGDKRALLRGLTWLSMLAACGDAAPPSPGEAHAAIRAPNFCSALPGQSQHVDVDVLPGRYPNLLREGETALAVALIAPRGRDLRLMGPLAAAAILTFEPGAPAVSASSPVELRDVNGDEWPDAVASFSIADLRAAGLLSFETTRLGFRATACDGTTTLAGSDRLFEAGSPVVEFPVPSGSEDVGTTELLLFDSSRPGDTAAGRALLLRLWYPAAPLDAQPTTYFLNDRGAELNAVVNQLPANFFDRVHAWSRRDARPSGTNHRPTLLLSHGGGSVIEFYAGIAEELASHGYLVVGVSHPDRSGIVVYPDGSVSTSDPTEEASTAASRRWTTDLEFVLGQLRGARCERSDAIDAAARRALALVDPARIGALGHSFGAAAALWAALESPSIRASASLDGAFWGDVLESGPSTPVLLMLSEIRLGLGDASLEQFLSHTPKRVYVSEVLGALHNNFADNAIILRSLGLPGADLGAIDPVRALAVQSAYLRAFFGTFLSGHLTNLLTEASAEFPEVTLTVHEPTGT